MEKSLGSSIKGGFSTINQVIESAEIPTENGVIIMNGASHDPEAMTALAAAGCQLILFSTSRGTPLGFPGLPVLKISSNNRLFQNLKSDIDINAGDILEGQRTIDETGRELIDFIKKVANGEKTKVEINRQNGMLCMYTRHRSF